jgi:hypothetical protein
MRMSRLGIRLSLPTKNKLHAGNVLSTASKQQLHTTAGRASDEQVTAQQLTLAGRGPVSLGALALVLAAVSGVAVTVGALAALSVAAGVVCLGASCA